MRFVESDPNILLALHLAQQHRPANLLYDVSEYRVLGKGWAERENGGHLKMQVRDGAANLGILVVSLVFHFYVVKAAQGSESATRWTKDGFEIRVIEPDAEQLIRNTCAKTQAFENGKYMSCYMSDWSAWVRQRRSAVIPKVERKQFDLFLSGGGILEGPATSYAVFPDGSRHLIWSAVDKFGGGVTYFFVSRTRRDVDVIWVGKGVRTKYFGPHAAILHDRNIGGWLPAVPFPGNPVNPIW